MNSLFNEAQLTLKRPGFLQIGMAGGGGGGGGYRFLVKAMFPWNECSKNDNIKVFSNFLAIFSNFFLDIEKFYQRRWQVKVCGPWSPPSGPICF